MSKKTKSNTHRKNKRYFEHFEEIKFLYQKSKDWNKVIAVVDYKNVKEAQDAFIDFVEEIYKTEIKDGEHLQKLTGIKINTPKELKNAIVKKGKFRRSGHLTDQILKYTYPKDESGQLSLWETLKDKTKQDIEVVGVERTEIVEGIKLTPSETKVIDSLCKLLHQRSQTSEPTDTDYYTGNLSPELVEYDGETTPAPKLGVTLYEFTKEYKGGDTISGKDVENVKQILTELNNKKFCIRYTEVTTGKGGKWIKKEYEKFRPIINLDLASLSYGVGNIEHYKKTETIIVLHPIFRRQIDSKFILYPNDITKRTTIAYGSHNVSSITIKLRDYLMRELSSKRYEPEIGIDRLYYQLAEKWMRESRKNKVKQYTERAFETMINLGLLKNFKIKTAKTSGEPKIVFTLNEDFE